MAEPIPGLREDAETGQRYAWSGYDWVAVPRDFDPRAGAFVEGLTRSVNRIGAGINQIVAAVAGDDAALFALGQQEQQAEAALSVLSRQSPIAAFAGQAVPYVAAGSAGGAAAAASGAGQTAAALAAGGVDAAIGALSYGSPGERALNAAIGIAAGAIPPVVGALRARRGGAAPGSTTPELGVDAPPLTGRGAGGPAVGGAGPGDFSEGAAGNLVDKLFKLARSEDTGLRLRQTATERQLARRWRIHLHPSAGRGSRLMADFEAGLQSDPFSAAPWIARQNRFNRQLEDATKEALLPNQRWEGPINRDFMRAAHDSVADDFAEIAQASNPIASGDVLAEARSTLSAEPVGMTKAIRSDFEDALKVIQEEGDLIAGDVAWTMQRDFAREAAEAADRGRGALSRMYYAVAQAIENQIVENAPDGVDVAKLQNVRKRFRLLKRFTTRNVVSDTDGLRYTPALRAMSDEFEEYRLGRGFIYGSPENSLMGPMNKLYEHLRVGQLFKMSRGDSGTATRLAFQNMTLNPLAASIRSSASALYYKLASTR